MPLPTGSRIGPYELLGLLGAGGMGEVYRARDTKLARDVAIKVLPQSFAADPDRLVRFDREAKTLASFSHTNIAAIYGVEQHALVMEFVDGEDLSAHIARGPMALHDALPIAKQIADALEAAHESGIIHRDLKPANIKVRADGTVKVLDFGLAKALHTAGGAGVSPPESGPAKASPSESPTVTSPAMTQIGMIIGTAAYMAPEQARGRVVDRRADIWAFGVVLYEMLSGRRAFQGDDVSITLASVLKDAVKWDALPADLPPALLSLIKRCLERDPKRRLGWIGEARFALEEPPAATRETELVVAQTRRSRALPWTIAALAVASAVAVLLLWGPSRAAPSRTPRQLLSNVGADVSLQSLGIGASAILSPDGETLAFNAASNGPSMLYVRQLDQLTATPLAGTEGAFNPFFSPRGDWIGFFIVGQMKKVRVTGGPVTFVCEAPNGRGATWLDDDTIIFSPSASANITLMRVPGAGGIPQPFGTFGENAVTQRWPQVLPGGTHVLYTENTVTTSWGSATIVVQPMAGGAPSVVIRGGYHARYVPGYLIYLKDDTILAAPFDLGQMKTTGASVRVVEHVSSNPGTGGAQFATSANGTLVYVPGTVNSMAPVNWLTSDGKTTPLRKTPSDWASPRFSPDGKRLALSISDGTQRDLWISDWARDTLTRLTFDPAQDGAPVWSPDGRRIAFSSDRGRAGTPNIYVANVDGTGEVTRLTTSDHAQIPVSWHPRDNAIFFQEARPSWDLMVLPVSIDVKQTITAAEPTVFLATPANETYPSISPDGRWIAYFSSTGAGSGRPDVFVRPYRGGGGPWQVTSDGATFPMWSATTSELLAYSPSRRRIVAMEYSVAGDAFVPGKLRDWSPATFRGVLSTESAALHPDGKRIAVGDVEAAGDDKVNQVVFFFNFAEYLKSLAK